MFFFDFFPIHCVLVHEFCSLIHFFNKLLQTSLPAEVVAALPRGVFLVGGGVFVRFPFVPQKARKLLCRFAFTMWELFESVDSFLFVIQLLSNGFVHSEKTSVFWDLSL